ncbi:MAG: hypothetical protein AAFY38_11710 [Pseudomonadota bacterium]
MDSDFTRLLGLNHVARAFGCGLKPELEQLLLRYHATRLPGVVPLNAALVSSGPTQFVSDETLQAAGVPRIGPLQASAKDGTDG